ncbi:hypothetical protein K440DRAFT_636762 [Wilcoxina mikolae CBS 423.85]|nr:hypothetical protein K440DRAFT_636762 [Wilcoxina mikolae CBS 423.85]
MCDVLAAGLGTTERHSAFRHHNWEVRRGNEYERHWQETEEAEDRHQVGKQESLTTWIGRGIQNEQYLAAKNTLLYYIIVKALCLSSSGVMESEMHLFPVRITELTVEETKNARGQEQFGDSELCGYCFVMAEEEFVTFAKLSPEFNIRTVTDAKNGSPTYCVAQCTLRGGRSGFFSRSWTFR